MNVKRVYPSGYCKGVIHAIELAKQTRKQYPDQKVTILGMIVHNSHVTALLEQEDIITLDDTKASKEELLDQIEEGVVIFTAHGISDHIRQKAVKKGLITIDATCEDVLKTRNIILNYLDQGYDILYFGKKGHPEAEAIISISPKIHLVSTSDDLKEAKIANPKLVLTNQTTMSYLELNDLIIQAKTLYPNLVVLKEICNATGSRQQAISQIENADAIYIVGDVRSNNTNKLKEIAKLSGIPNVFMISDRSEIKKEDLNGLNDIYVSAGASTPPELIDEVVNYLRSL